MEKFLKVLKGVLLYLAILLCGIIIVGVVMLLLHSIDCNKVGLIWVSSSVLVAIVTLLILLYVKSEKFNAFIMKHKTDVFFTGSFMGFLIAMLTSRSIILRNHINDPILWNWIIGTALVLFIVLTIVYYSRYIKIKDDNLKLQIEPHTIRNIIEDIRLKTKSIAKDVNNRVYVENEDNAIKSKINSLHYEMESTCDFLSEIAEDNSRGKNMNSIAEEFENVKRYLGFRTNNDLSNITIENHITKPKFEVPSRITTPIIENAFKHGDVGASDFLNVSFMQKDDNYIIEVRNRVVKTDLSLAKTTGLGINNLKQRVKLYNETQSSYTASLYNANKNDFYYFRIIFEKRD